MATEGQLSPQSQSEFLSSARVVIFHTKFYGMDINILFMKKPKTLCDRFWHAIFVVPNYLHGVPGKH